MATELAPALTLDEITSTLEHLTPGQLRYIEALQEAPSKHKACEQAGITEQSLAVWRCRHPDFKALDDAFSLRQDGFHRTAIARALLSQHAPRASLRIIQLAEAPAKTDRQLQVALQASVKVLEATGVLKAGGGVQVNVDNRRVDVYAKERWLSEGQDAWRGRKRKQATDTKAPDAATKAGGDT